MNGATDSSPGGTGESAAPVPHRQESVLTAEGERFGATAALPLGRGPGLLLLQEIFGVGEFLLHKADALARQGYVVLCPDLFWRIEPNVVLGHDEEGLAQAFSYAERFGELDPGLTTGDLLAGLAHLRSMPEIDGPTGVMGYCLGGRLAYEVAVAGDPDCCVSYYGSGIAARLGDASRLGCPAIFHFGGDDPFIPVSEAEAVRAAFADRSDVECHIHEGAGHAFENSFAPAFSDPAAASRSWPLTLDFLSRWRTGALTTDRPDTSPAP
jgi:carboxymethylenebutenolidase